jgi:hypothetical protein
MKRVKDGKRVIRGELTINTYSNRVQLFDGLFTTGYRVTKLEISPRSPTENNEVLVRVSTEEAAGNPLAYWDFSDVRQVAWARWGAPNAAAFGMESIIDPNNMAVEDLWLSTYSTIDTGSIQYQLTLEKYEFPAWDGAATLVKNQSQAGPE